MGRSAKPTSVNSKHLSKDEREIRAQTEQFMRGDTDKLEPPDWLTPRQREVFLFLLSEMEAGGILGNADIFILTRFSVAVARLEEIEQGINEKPSSLYDKDLMAAKAKYAKDFDVGLRELSLSPQARAKLGGLALANKKKEEDPVLTLLKGKGKISSA